jgi:hypothetical protein|tara:strand:+ start:351 stop:539 length:189 start_codon:yes stop_codon:yes gene_type:complete
MREDKIVYKTLDEIKLDIIKRIVMEGDQSPVSVTRCYETLTGTLISHSAGEDAPTGKFKIVN